MKAEDTFLTEAKPTATTTKERQIDFMWHLYRQKYTYAEIGKLYDVNKDRVRMAVYSRLKKQSKA